MSFALVATHHFERRARKFLRKPHPETGIVTPACAGMIFSDGWI